MHPVAPGRLDDVDCIEITNHESAIRIIHKTGPLHNPADRDHCIQFMTAIGLIFGQLTADHYEDKAAADPRIDALRAKMVITENKQYSRDYLDPDKRSIPNALQVHFRDGSKTGKIEVHYPIGHRRRRVEGIPVLIQKAKAAFAAHYGFPKADELMSLFNDFAKLEVMPVHQFMAALAK